MTLSPEKTPTPTEVTPERLAGIMRLYKILGSTASGGGIGSLTGLVIEIIAERYSSETHGLIVPGAALLGFAIGAIWGITKEVKRNNKNDHT